MPEDPRLNRFFKFIYLERGLLLGAGALLVGLVLLLGAVHQWGLADLGTNGLRPYNAMGDSQCDIDRAGISDHTV